MTPTAATSPLDLFRSLTDFINLPSILGSTAVLVGAVLLYACFRTRSPHVLLVRLWKVMNGSSASSNKKIATFIEGQTELMRFRFFSGLLSPSVKSAEAIIDWSDKYNVSVDLIKKAGPYFSQGESEPVGLTKTPPKWAAALIFIPLMLSTYAALGSGLLTIPSSLLLHTKESKVWFFLSETNVSRLDRHGGTIAISNCASSEQDMGKQLDLLPTEIGAVCKLEKDGKLKSYLDSEIRTQRTLLAIFFVFFAFFSRITWVFGMQMLSARTIAKKIKANGT